MYAVSEEYREAMHSKVQTFRLTGTAGNKPFTEANILKGSFSITNQCSGSDAVEIGQVYIGELNATFMNMGITRYQWQALEITPLLGLKLANGTYEDIPLGVFTVAEAEWTASGTVIKAYDHMAKFDRNYGGGNAKGEPYDLMLNACNHCGVPLGMTQAQVEALPNGTETLSVYTTDNIDTWRDFLSWLSQAMGCFATIDRTGALVFRKYTQVPVDTLDTEHRFSGASFSDYTTRYTGLSCVDLSLQKTMYINVTPDDGLTYNLGSNPFLQRGGGDAPARRRAVLEALLAVNYVPFRVTAIGNPAYDLGDCLRFTDGLADGSLSCITKYVFTFNDKYEMQGAGEDPAYASAKSKSDKDISGLLSTVSETAIQFYFFVSVTDVLVEDGRGRMVVDLDYTAREGASVVFHGEIKHQITLTPKPEPEPEPDPQPDTDPQPDPDPDTNGSEESGGENSGESGGDGSDPDEAGDGDDPKPVVVIPEEAVITVTYYINGEQVTEYHPVDNETAGTHLLHLQYFWDVPEDTLDGDFQVWIRMDKAKMDIRAGEARGYLMGQGLAAELEKKLRYIYISTLPETRDYLEGTYLDYTGIVVMALYQDGSTEDITGLCTFSPEDFSLLETVGEIPCVATYTDEDGNQYRDGFSITVEPKTLEYIEITLPPSKTDYVLGEAYDYDGLIVTAYYNNETSEEVTELCSIVPAEGTVSDTDGTIPVTVSYTHNDVTKDATFDLNVLVLDYIEVTTMPTDTEFTEEDPYDYDGLVITAYFEDGSSKIITDACTYDPAPGTPAVYGTDTVNVTYTPSAASSASTSFAITVKKKAVPTVKAIQLLPTTFEESLASIRTVMNIPNKMMQRINSKKSSVFGNMSLNIVLCAGNCNYSGSGSVRFALMDITPWVNREKYIYQFTDPAPGVSQGVRIPSEYTMYREFYPHQYFWENCSGNNIFYIVANEGEIQEDEALTTPWASDLCIGFGSDVYSYNPFPQTGGQPYQALAANYMIVDVPDPNA